MKHRWDIMYDKLGQMPKIVVDFLMINTENTIGKAFFDNLKKRGVENIFWTLDTEEDLWRIKDEGWDQVIGQVTTDMPQKARQLFNEWE